MFIVLIHDGLSSKEEWPTSHQYKGQRAKAREVVVQIEDSLHPVLPSDSLHVMQLGNKVLLNSVTHCDALDILVGQE